MLASIATTALFLLGTAQASPLDLAARQTTACQAVHVFIARGSTEPYPGRQGALATAICSGLSSCGYEDITYPAAYSPYCDSVQAGVVNGKAAITAYASRCPNAKLVLTGYSQVSLLVSSSTLLTLSVLACGWAAARRANVELGHDADLYTPRTTGRSSHRRYPRRRRRQPGQLHPADFHWIEQEQLARQQE